MPEQEQQHTEAVNELIWLMDGHSDVKALLEKSIAKAAAANPDRRYNPAQTLAEFYNFVLVFQRDVNVQLLHSGDHLLMGEAYAHLTLTKQ